MNINKNACRIGMLLGVVIVVIGIVFLTMDVFSGYYASYNYDSGVASFGGDFYTYVNNNAAEAASNVRHVGEAIEKAFHGFGVLMICFGLFDTCLFWAFMGPKDTPVVAPVPCVDSVEDKKPEDDMEQLPEL